jgi:3-oxoadipate enol-lactonase
VSKVRYTTTLGDHTVEVTDVPGGLDPAILVHSAILEQTACLPLARRLPGRRVISYDLRGHGSAAGAPRIRDIKQLAADLLTLLDRLELSRCHLIGISLGGAVVQELAAISADRVRSVVVVASAREFDTSKLRARATELDTDGRGPTVARTLERWFTPSALARNDSHVEYARACLLTVSTETWCSVWNALADFRLPAEAQFLRAPVLAVAGTRDRSTPPDVVRRVADAYPSGTYAEISGAPHLACLERPSELGAIVHGFLRSVELARPTVVTAPT